MSSNKYQRAYYKKHFKRIQEYKRKYYLANKAKFLERNKTRREEIKNYLKERYIKNRNKFRIYSKKYYRKNKEWKLAHNRKRRIRKKNAPGIHTLEQWNDLKKLFKFVCPCCGKREPEITLTEDHIIPLSKGGSDWIENIQPLCHSCNAKKHTDIIKYNVT